MFGGIPGPVLVVLRGCQGRGCLPPCVASSSGKGCPVNFTQVAWWQSHKCAVGGPSLESNRHTLLLHLWLRA